MPKTFAYVSNADSREIVVLRLAEDGALAEIERVKTPGMVMPLAVAPDCRFLFAALRSEPFGAASYRIDRQTGRLAQIATVPLPASMAYIATDRTGRFLMSASYPSAVAAVSAIDAEGRVGAAPLQVLSTAPNAHCIVTDPANRYAFVPCLGGDLVMQLRFDAAGRLSANATPEVRTWNGAGPRHLAFHPGGKMALLINELDASVMSFAYDAAAGTLSPRETVSALPPDFSGKPWAADIHITPDGRFVYASERTASTLAGFRLDAATGKLTAIGHWPTETQPRGFAIEPGGRYLLSAGQISNSLTVHAIEPATGALRPLKRYPMGANPNWVEIVDLA